MAAAETLMVENLTKKGFFELTLPKPHWIKEQRHGTVIENLVKTPRQKPGQRRSRRSCTVISRSVRKKYTDTVLHIFNLLVSIHIFKISDYSVVSSSLYVRTTDHN